jgi:hypothetical protein
MKGSKKFIECDGIVVGTVLSQIASIGGIFGSMKAKAKEEWIPRKIYFKASDIGEMSYYPEVRKFVEEVAPPPLRMPGLAEMMAGGGLAEMLAPPPIPPPDQNNVIITYAPAGWYFCPDWTKTQYHIARDADAEQLANSNADSDVAQALYKLAEEIALKPTSVPGTEFLKVQNEFYEA